MKELLNVSGRTIILIILMFFLFKLIGKKQISQISLFDYIVGITIGSVVADISLDIEKSMLSGIIVLLLYGLISKLISFINLKSVHFRQIFNGREDVIIKDGKIIRENLSKNMVTIDDLVSEARVAGYFCLDDINTAIIEANGRFSFELKEKEKPTSKKDIGMNSKNSGLVYNLIIDGKVIKENLKYASVNMKWLNQQLNVLGKKSNDILLFTISEDSKFKVFYK